ncbi:MAG: glycosyltransferase [Sumerlaeia bacterium]
MTSSETTPSTPSVSVVVCTRNSKHRVEETLRSLRTQSMARERYEVLVVDNASDDGTDEILQALCAELELTYIEEPELGLSAARNRGILDSAGELIYFIDDDAVAPPFLLDVLWADFVRENADAVGGAVHGLWEETPPAWLNSNLWRGLSLLSYGNEARPLVYPEILIGTNVGFRRNVFERYGYFDPDLGRKGDNLMGNEERALEKRILEDGGLVFYNPSAFVFHKVPIARMTHGYMFERIRQASLSVGRMRDSDLTRRRIVEPLWKASLRVVYDSANRRVVPICRGLYRAWITGFETFRVEMVMLQAALRARKELQKANHHD